MEVESEQKKADQILKQIEYILRGKKVLAGMDFIRAVGPVGKVQGRANKFKPIDHPEWQGVKDIPKDPKERESKKNLNKPATNIPTFPPTAEGMEDLSKSPDILGTKSIKQKKLRTSQEFRAQWDQLEEQDYTMVNYMPSEVDGIEVHPLYKEYHQLLTEELPRYTEINDET